MSLAIRVETLTGAQARHIVSFSDLHGYGVRERIDAYKEWMRNGKWSLFYNGTDPKLINDPLIFRANGRLLEGKHRVIALSELNEELALEFWVLRNFTEIEAFNCWIEDVRARKVRWRMLPGVNDQGG